MVKNFMKKNIYSLMFPLFISMVPPLSYILLNDLNINNQVIKFIFLIFFVNLGWISFIHLFKKRQTLILSIYMTISIVFSTYIVFFGLDNDFQYYIIYGIFITGIIGLSFFIKRKKRKGEI